MSSARRPHQDSRRGLLLLVLVAFAARAEAQVGPDRDPRGQAPDSASSSNEVAQPGEPATDDDTSLETATPDPAPPVPMPLQRGEAAPTLDVIEEAGVGGPTAFASSGVLEVGGSGSLVANQDSAMAKLAPFVGWFPYDGVELTFTHEIFIGSDDAGALRVSTLAVVEASGHLRLGDRLLAFIGAGPGVLFDGTDAGFALKSRLGTDVLVGRSGILRPSIFVLWATTEVLDLVGVPTQHSLAFGLELAYAAMF